MLDRRVQSFIGDRRTVDSPLMYAKAAALIGASVWSYTVLVFQAETPLAVLLSEIGRAHV